MADALLSNMIDSGCEIRALIGIVVINIFIQLLVLKLEYKVVISIKGVIGIVFSHIATIGMFELWIYFFVTFPAYLF